MKGGEQQGFLKKSILSHLNQVSKHSTKYADRSVHSSFTRGFCIDQYFYINEDLTKQPYQAHHESQSMNEKSKLDLCASPLMILKVLFFSYVSHKRKTHREGKLSLPL